ncbi:Uncharacterised protein [uncultured archaeon]|nr:Uncharacterised protein [uncultured archaeon]
MIRRRASPPGDPSCIPLARGTYREVFVEGGMCVKSLLPYRERRYPPHVVLLHPMQDYLKHKFGIDDLNLFELDNYRRFFSDAGAGVEGRFARILDVDDDCSRMELIRDFDGSVSRSLKDYGRVQSGGFWDAMREVKRFVQERRIPLFDLNECNVLVQRLDERRLVPVLIDYKHVGPQLFPYQF